MKYDKAGTYEIEYTATDECGNVSEGKRTVNVVAPAIITIQFLVANESTVNLVDDFDSPKLFTRTYRCDGNDTLPSPFDVFVYDDGDPAFSPVAFTMTDYSTSPDIEDGTLYTTDTVIQDTFECGETVTLYSRNHLEPLEQ